MKISIIGAGPGGLITGLRLIEAGFQPEILEKKPEISTTLCAEGISKDTLEQVPFGPWEKYAFHSFDHATFIFPENQRAYVNKPCYTMDRSSWFRAMAKAFEKKGGIITFNQDVTESSIKNIQSDIIIDSSGPLSWIARKLVHNSLVIKPGVQFRMNIPDYQYDGMEFFLDKRYSNEYSWIFMKHNTANVGLLGTLSQLKQFISDKQLGGTILKTEAYNIPFFGTNMNTTFHQKKIILMGDAAGITNPLTKGGMACIIHASRLLVDLISENRPEEFSKTLLTHPMMAPEYHYALDFFQKLDNRKLNLLGSMVNGQSIDHLSFGMRLKILLASLRNFNEMRTLMKAASYANKYSW